jgi:hypothetical protein
VNADPPPVLEYRTTDPTEARRNWRDGATPIMLGLVCWLLTWAGARIIGIDGPTRFLPRPLRGIPLFLGIGAPAAIAVAYIVAVFLRKLRRPRLYFLYASILALAAVTLARLLQGP